MLHAKEHTLDIDRLLPAPVFEAGFQQRAHNGDAGIVDQPVQRPSGLGHFPPARLVGYVLEHEAPAGPLGGLAPAALVDVGRKHRGAGRCRGNRRRPPDAGARPRNQNRLAVECAHRSPSRPVTAIMAAIERAGRLSANRKTGRSLPNGLHKGHSLT